MIKALVRQTFRISQVSPDSGAEPVSHTLRPSADPQPVPRWVQQHEGFAAAEKSGWVAVTEDTPDEEADPAPVRSADYLEGYAAGLADASKDALHAQAQIAMLLAQQEQVSGQSIPGLEVKPVEDEAPGSGTERYNQKWDTGFAQNDDPYGIGAEYITQSPSPNAATFDKVIPPAAPSTGNPLTTAADATTITEDQIPARQPTAPAGKGKNNGS